MPPRSSIVKKLTLGLVVIVSLAALALTLLTPGFQLDNELVYGGF
jgi:hypothetical protein